MGTRRIRIVVFGAFFQPTHMPCTECGASVELAFADAHACDEERRLDYRLSQLKDEIAAFDAQLTAWLESAYGRFAAWLAERDR
jgi:hypothetical protein